GCHPSPVGGPCTRRVACTSPGPTPTPDANAWPRRCLTTCSRNSAPSTPHPTAPRTAPLSSMPTDDARPQLAFPPWRGPMASSKRRRRSSPDLRWYASEKQPHEAIHAATQKLLRDDRRDRLLLWRALYLDEDGYDYSRHRMYRPGMRMRFNLIRSVVETLLARIGKSQPDPMVVTVGGD